MIRAAFALAMALLLAGCDMWVGPRFYTLAEATNPFQPGTYRIAGGDKPEVIRWDGKALYENGRRLPKKEQPGSDMITVPLQTAGRQIFILQSGSDDGAVYGILEKRGEHYVLDLPSCHHTLAIAREAGAKIHSNIEVTAEPIDDLFAESSPTRHRKSVRQRKLQSPAEPVEAEDLGNCEFLDRASFEMAARRYIRERQLIGMTIDRIPDQAKAERRH